VAPLDDDKHCHDECHRAHLARSVRPVRDVRHGHRALAVVFFDHESGVAGKGARYWDAPDMAPLPAGPSRDASEFDDGAGCGQPTPKSFAVAISVLYRSRAAAWRSTG